MALNGAAYRMMRKRWSIDISSVSVSYFPMDVSKPGQISMGWLRNKNIMKKKESNRFLDRSLLSSLPGHVTRFLTPYGLGEIDCPNRLNVIQTRSAVQWHSIFAFFFPFLHDILESFRQRKTFFLINFSHVSFPNQWFFLVFYWIVTKEPPFVGNIGNANSTMNRIVPLCWVTLAPPP